MVGRFRVRYQHQNGKSGRQAKTGAKAATVAPGLGRQAEEETLEVFFPPQKMAGRLKAKAEPYGPCQGKGQPSVKIADKCTWSTRRATLKHRKESDETDQTEPKQANPRTTKRTHTTQTNTTQQQTPNREPTRNILLASKGIR